MAEADGRSPQPAAQAQAGSRMVWADMARGLCMLAILFFHTEMYYAGRDLIPYSIYVENVLTVFFFISGYMFCRPGAPFSLRRKAGQVVRGLLVPYFIFTVPICLVKPFAHGREFDFAGIMADELTGMASWFVAALIVAELLFGLMVSVTRGRMGRLAVMAAVSVAMAFMFGNMAGGIAYNDYNLWHVNEALLAVFFLFLGYLYRRREKTARRLCKWPVWLVCIILLVVLKHYEWSLDLRMVVGPVIVSSWSVFMADCVLFITVFIGVMRCLFPTDDEGTKKVPHAVCVEPYGRNIVHIAGLFLSSAGRYVEFVGRRSLYFYFFCGASPTLVSLAVSRFCPYDGSRLMMLAVFFVVCVVCSLAVWVVLRLRRVIAVLSSGRC